MIVARGLRKRYVVGDTAVDALAGVDLKVAEGEHVALVGPSGSGKTTLLNLVGGLDRADGGELSVAGRALASLSSDALARYRGETVGFVFQSFRLLGHLTALENVALPLVLAGSPRREAERRAAELLALVGLASRHRHRPAQLSAGEQQRVAVARALARAPDVLLADEPTGNLDAAAGAELLALFATLRERDRLTLLVATHNADVAARADRVVRLRAGRVETMGAGA